MANTVTTGTPVFLRAVFTGGAAAGPISVPGVKAGDIMLQFANGAGYIGDSIFESGTTITVDDQIQQIQNVNYSGITLTLYLLRWV